MRGGRFLFGCARTRPSGPEASREAIILSFVSFTGLRILVEITLLPSTGQTTHQSAEKTFSRNSRKVAKKCQLQKAWMAVKHEDKPTLDTCISDPNPVTFLKFLSLFSCAPGGFCARQEAVVAFSILLRMNLHFPSDGFQPGDVSLSD